MSTVHIVFVLDRSSSMSALAQEAADGFNLFVAEQRKLPGKARLTLIQFNTGVEVVCEKVKLKNAPTLTVGTNYAPAGLTALNDALGQAIARHDGEDKVLVAVLTDGQENSSREYSKHDLKELIERKTADGWQFNYLSSDLNAFADAASYGILRDHTVQVQPDAAGLRTAFAASTTMSTHYRANNS